MCIVRKFFLVVVELNVQKNGENLFNLLTIFAYLPENSNSNEFCFVYASLARTTTLAHFDDFIITYVTEHRNAKFV